MTERIHCDICIIGGGSGGLSVAAGAAQLGASTVLIEKGKMGGDCLNYGCVPSKSLIAAAKRFHHARHSTAYGVHAPEAFMNIDGVMAHVNNVIKTIEPHDSVERFEGLGVKVIQDHGRFAHHDEVIAGPYRIRSRWIVVATGSRASIPPIPGLADLDYWINETIFSISYLPRHLIVIGAGPIGCELAQSFCRLGSEVSVVDIGPMLSKDDPELTSIVRQSLERDGVKIYDRASDLAFSNGPDLEFNHHGKDGVKKTISLKGSDVLVATGRVPNTEGLNLEQGQIRYSRQGIQTDAYMKTSNRRVFAIGDVAGKEQFTHAAGYHAGIVIKNALFRLPSKAKATIPWVTYTDPELAQVGLSEEQAKHQHIECKTVRWDFAGNDRALAEGETAGKVKIIARPNGQILGASLAGPQAGDLLAMMVLAVEKKMKLSELASMVLPYPTLSETLKRAAGSFYTDRLFSDKTRALIRFLLKYT